MRKLICRQALGTSWVDMMLDIMVIFGRRFMQRIISTLFEKKGLLNPKVGNSYRRMTEQGKMVDAVDILQEFLGRKPNWRRSLAGFTLGRCLTFKELRCMMRRIFKKMEPRRMQFNKKPLSSLSALMCLSVVVFSSSVEAGRDKTRDLPSPQIQLIRSDYGPGEIKSLCEKSIKSAGTELDEIVKAHGSQKSDGNPLLSFEQALTRARLTFDSLSL